MKTSNQPNLTEKKVPGVLASVGWIAAGMYLFCGLAFCWFALTPAYTHSRSITSSTRRDFRELGKLIVRREVATVLGPLPRQEPAHSTYLIVLQTGEQGAIKIPEGMETAYGIDCGRVEVIVYSLLDGLVFQPVSLDSKPQRGNPS